MLELQVRIDYDDRSSILNPSTPTDVLVPFDTVRRWARACPTLRTFSIVIIADSESPFDSDPSSRMYMEEWVIGINGAVDVTRSFLHS